MSRAFAVWNAMVVNVEKINEVNYFAACVRKVPLKAKESLARVRQSVRIAQFLEGDNREA